MSSFSTRKFLSERIFCICRNVRNLNISFYVKLLLILLLLKVQKKNISAISWEVNNITLYDNFRGQRKLNFVVSGKTCVRKFWTIWKQWKSCLQRLSLSYIFTKFKKLLTEKLRRKLIEYNYDYLYVLFCNVLFRWRSLFYGL